jgi:hypothetical protein
MQGTVCFAKAHAICQPSLQSMMWVAEGRCFSSMHDVWPASLGSCRRESGSLILTLFVYVITVRVCRTAVDEYTDEILMTIAEVAGTLVPALGGGESAHTLLPLLEALAEKDETFVRTKVHFAVSLFMIRNTSSIEGARLKQCVLHMCNKLDESRRPCCHS